MDKKTQLHSFWFDNLDDYERKLLRKAAFSTPEDFYDLPVVSLANINRFGFECAVDLLEAILKYKKDNGEDFSFNEEVRTAKEFDFFYEDDDEISNGIDSVLINIDFLLLDHGFDSDEKTVRMTVRQFFELKVEWIELMFNEIIQKYNKLYCQPKDIPNKTRADILSSAEMLFQYPRG